MTAPSSFTTTSAVRNLSTRAFNSTYRVEVALAVLTLDSIFTFDELWEVVQEVSRSSGVEEPSQSKVRAELDRLRDIGALERLPRPKGTLVQREIRRDSRLWELCRELFDRAT